MMKNRTDVVGISLMQRAKQQMKTYRVVVEGLLHGVIGLIMANSFLLGDLSPFGVAYVASVKNRSLFPAAVGAMVGYLISFRSAENTRYIGALILLVAVRWIFADKKALQASTAFPPMAAFGCMTATSIVLALATKATPYGILLYASEVLLASASTYFFTKTLGLIDSGFDTASKSELSCTIITFGILVLAFMSVYVGPVSVGRVVAATIILVAACYGGEAAGSIAGITAGIAAGVIGDGYGYLMGVYSLGGLLSGVFSTFGRFGCAVTLVLVNGAGIFFAPDKAHMLPPVYEVFAATVLFLLIPKGIMSRMALGNVTYKAVPDSQLVKTLVMRRLHSAAHSLREIADTTQKVSAKLKNVGGTDISAIFQRTCQKICGQCGFRHRCWEREYNDTMNVLNDTVPVLRSQGNISLNNLSGHFLHRCYHGDEIVNCINNEYADFITREGASRKVSQVRSVVTDQFDGMAMLIDGIYSELKDITSCNRELTKKVAEYFTAKGVQPFYCNVYEDQDNRMTVETSIPAFKLPRLDSMTTTLELSDLCDREFEIPRQQTDSQGAVLTFVEKATYSVKQESYQLAHKGASLCGDSVEYLSDPTRGMAYLILSDGMGSGNMAAVDSNMTTNLLSRLISAGVGFDAALKMVNSALLVKSGEESLATVDIMAMDLYTGRTDFYKAGAAPTFVLRGGKAGYVESMSLPAGILSGVEFEKSSIQLKAGDLVVMVSDGVVATGVEWVLSELQNAPDKTPAALAKQIAEVAKARRIDGHEDDITVAVAAVEKGI